MRYNPKSRRNTSSENAARLPISPHVPMLRWETQHRTVSSRRAAIALAEAADRRFLKPGTRRVDSSGLCPVGAIVRLRLEGGHSAAGGHAMRRLFSLFILISIGPSVPPANADTLDFDDRPPSNDESATLAEEYAHQGVHFTSTDDGAVWGGMSAGDVGGWQIEGTSGPAFLGFDGNSYEVTLDFDVPVANFQLDASRAQGAMLPFIDTLLVAGFLDGAFRNGVELYLGAVNHWMTVTLDGEIDRVFVYGYGIRGMRFGIDNISWNETEAALRTAEIDIRPGSDENPINPKSRGVIPVLTYGSAELDVEMIDPGLIVFGPGDSILAHSSGPHFFDADADGWLDMLTHHRTQESGLTSEDFEACLFAETYEGTALKGCDWVTPVPR
jgi:hypothetical protein